MCRFFAVFSYLKKRSFPVSSLGKFAPRRRKDSKFYTLVKLVMSTASINNNDNDSISSSSMENDLRDYANRQSVLKEGASNDGTVSSLRQYLSVPFFSTSLPGPGSSAVSSDQDSVSCVGSVDGGEGSTKRSRADSALSKPSIFITAPPSDEKMSPSQDVDVELGEGGRRSPCGSDFDGSVGSEGDVEDGEFSDVFEEDEEEEDGVTEERKQFLNNRGQNRFTDSDSELAPGKTEVAFYLGSRASLNKLTFLEEGATSTQSATCDIASQENSNGAACNERTPSDSDMVIIPNINLQPQKYGRFLTVPLCTVPVSAVTTRALLTTNNNNNNNNNNNDDDDVEGISSIDHEADFTACSSETKIETAIENDKSSNAIYSESKVNLDPTITTSSKEAPGTTECGAVADKDGNFVWRPSSSEERRKRFASSSPPRIISSLDMEEARKGEKDWMKRSLSESARKKPPETFRTNSSPLLTKDLSHRGYSLCPPYGSPVPRKRLPEVRTRRKTYATVSCRSDSSDSDIPRPLVQHSSQGTQDHQREEESVSNANSSNTQHPHRKHHKRRHHSGGGGGGGGRHRHSSGEDLTSLKTLLLPRQQSDAATSSSRARSESPSVSAMSLLKVPGFDNRRRSVDSPGDNMDNQEVKVVSSSKSMNDMTSDGNGNPFANNVGRDGKILRSSCLSLNSARHKRRGKSPHRVSFKVS